MSEAKKLVHDGKRNALGIVFGPADTEDDGEHDMEEGEDGEDGADGYGEDEKAALEEAFDAVKKGDKDAFCEAMSAAMRICYMHAEKGEGEEEEAEEEHGKKELSEY